MSVVLYEAYAQGHLAKDKSLAGQWSNISGDEMGAVCDNVKASGKMSFDKCIGEFDKCGGNNSCERKKKKYLEDVANGYTGSYNKWESERASSNQELTTDIISGVLTLGAMFSGLASGGQQQQQQLTPEQQQQMKEQQRRDAGGRKMSTGAIVGISLGVLGLITVIAIVAKGKKDNK